MDDSYEMAIDHLKDQADAAEDGIDELESLRARAEKAESERDALAAMGLCWQPMATFRKSSVLCNNFLLLPNNSDEAVMMRQLTESFAHDFKDHEDTYWNRKRFSHWMPLPAHPESPRAQQLEQILAAHDAPLIQEIQRLRDELAALKGDK